ncbi:MAG: DUF4345 domain-containing protein [Rhizobiaceae bacterium]|nr:DUF4345 domain-containing protein [Rhizobiaceae bacterium]
MVEIVFPDDWSERLAWLSAMATLVIGLAAMLFPQTIGHFLGLFVRSGSNNGLSELRSSFGGMWVGLGLACIILAQPFTYFALGLAFLGALLGRLIAMVVDRSFNLHCLVATVIVALGAYFPLRFALEVFGLV